MVNEWHYPNITPPHKTKPEYKVVPTILDESNPNSQLNKSEFHGFFNLAVIFFATFLFTQPVVSWLEDGKFLEDSLFETFKQDYLLCIMVWPLFFLWSFNSFLLEKMIVLGMHRYVSLTFQHLTQSGLFIFSSYLILTRNWCSSHTAFVIIQACAHFMKMHSYTTVNRDYRQQKEQALREGKQPMTNYPANISLEDFTLFMWTPWLVYDTYPRKSTISVVYILKKSIITIICILMAYIIHTQYLIPIIESGHKYGHFQLILRCMLPSTFLFVLLFYIVFQSITNIFAQITKLSHRQFYEDWWNSTTYEEFNRKWNKPVHFFLYKHVYLELILRWKVNKNRAQAITFLFSAMLHEYLLALIFRIVRPFFLGFIVGQVPLIYLTKFMQGKKSGTYVFWLGIIIGPSIIGSCYLQFSDVIFLK